MNLATVIPSTVSVASATILPDGVRCIETDYDGTHDSYKAAPVCLSYEGRTYVRCSHNSDTRRICYRTDWKCASV